MRLQHTLALIAAAGCSLSALAAPPSANNEASGAAMASVPVVANAPHTLQRFEFEGAQGDYALSDGRTLRVSTVRHKLYAQLGAERVELVPVAQNVLVTRDEGMHLRFDQLPFATTVKVDVRVN